MPDHRTHAFSDDALGEHDAVGLVAALHAGTVSIPEVIEAAIARAERMQPELNGIAHAAFDRARAEAREPRPGFFAGVPTWIKDNVDAAGMPTMQGTDAWEYNDVANDFCLYVWYDKATNGFLAQASHCIGVPQ